MELGLKRGTVALLPHDPAWEALAAETIAALKTILGDDAVDIQHVGSTAIRGIPAKPILDLAVGVRHLEDVRRHDDALERWGFIFRGSTVPEEWLYVQGDFAADTRTHHIHVLEWNSTRWQDYLNFRDYLNAVPAEARRYARLKEELAAVYSGDRGAYTAGKQELIRELLARARRWREAQNA